LLSDCRPVAAGDRGGLIRLPGNVIVGLDQVRITDFGLGSLGPGPPGAGAPASGRPASGLADGLLGYQAPELADGAAGTPPADVYAVGVLFAACLGGGQPGRPGSWPRLSATAGARVIPASLAGLWAACLATSPRDRPGAAHVAVLVRQALTDIAGPGTGPWAAMAVSSPRARRPAAPAARWPG
jgi:eukaryotic-like serine/threonine-protein kinase